jgi:hypothetical protein
MYKHSCIEALIEVDYLYGGMLYGRVDDPKNIVLVSILSERCLRVPLKNSLPRSELKIRHSHATSLVPV